MSLVAESEPPCVATVANGSGPNCDDEQRTPNHETHAPSHGIFVRTIEVQWHYSAPSEQDADRHGLQGRMEGVISIDFHPTAQRLLTTGGDCAISIWTFNESNVHAWLRNSAEDMTKCCTWVTTMRCQDMPRCARWSPAGNLVASGHSDPRIRLWWRTTASDTVLNQESDSLEQWKDYRVLTGHLHDVMDLAFSPDAKYLVSAGMHGTVMVHDLDASSPVVSIEAHNKFCYGVAWDPWNRVVASFGGGPGLLLHSVVPASEHRRLQLAGQRRSQTVFHGEGYSSAMRRLSWSPDGGFLAVPFCKNIATGVDPEMRQCVAIFNRAQAEPTLRIAVRGANVIRGALWAPCFLRPSAVSESEEDASSSPLAAATMPWGPRDYGMALAVWSDDMVVVYTTDMSARHSDFSDLHVLSIADLTWSPDAKHILTCSLDGYVTVLFFDNQLIGPAYRVPSSFCSTPLVRGISEIISVFSDAATTYETKKTAAVATSTSAPHATAVVVKKRRRTEKADTATASSSVIAASEIGIADLEQLIDS